MSGSRSLSEDASSIESAIIRSPQTQRVRAYKGASEDEMVSDASSDDVASASEEDDDEPRRSSDGRMDEDASELDRSTSPPSDAPPPDEELANISFGALVKAQSALGKRKRPATDPTDDPAPPQAASSSSTTTTRHPNHTTNHDPSSEALERRAGKNDHRDFARPSKHAPTELSAKKAVSRKRSVVHVPRSQSRDPRFEPVMGSVDGEQLKRNYAFLEEYRDAEMAELKAGVRKERDPRKRETLQRALKSMEGRRRTQQLKDQRQEVVRRHRKEEREKVGGGKKPFYLKKGEVKERALKERFKGMKSQQVDKVIARRRKKLTARERKDMPLERRG